MKRGSPAVTTERKWRVIAIDDEPPALKRLQSLLASTAQLELIGSYDDAAAGREAIERDRPDVVFLDIQMPEMNGLEVAASLQPPVPLIIFVTAYDEHALQAFEVNAADYLLKPVSRERFASAATRVVERLTHESRDEYGESMRLRLDAVLAHLKLGGGRPAAFSGRVPLKVNDRILMIPAASIDRAESAGNNLKVIAGREIWLVRETLTAFSQRMPPEMFLRVSRSVLVRVDRVVRVEPWFHGELVLILADGTQVTTGRTYREEVRRVLRLLGV